MSGGRVVSHSDREVIVTRHRPRRIGRAAAARADQAPERVGSTARSGRGIPRLNPSPHLPRGKTRARGPAVDYAQHRGACPPDRDAHRDLHPARAAGVTASAAPDLATYRRAWRPAMGAPPGTAEVTVGARPGPSIGHPSWGHHAKPPCRADRWSRPPHSGRCPGSKSAAAACDRPNAVRVVASVRAV